MNDRGDAVLAVVRYIGTFLTAWMLIIGILVFLDRLLTGLQNPDLAAIDAATIGIVVGGLISILAAVVNSLFQQESARNASRSSAQATQAGVTAAMSVPPTAAASGEPTVVPTFMPTEDPNTAGVFMCPVDGLTFTTQALLDQHLAEVHPAIE